jgi:hypothetical protein
MKTNIYTDTLFSEVKSLRGHNCAQMFVSDQGFASIYTMKSKAEAPDKLNTFVREFGIPRTLISDNAGEETSDEWNRIRKEFLILQCFTEPYSPWQNKAEREIGELKQHYRRVMHHARCPETLWDFGMTYVASLRLRMSRDTLDGRTPFEATNGETPDISEYLDFNFYSWCKFIDGKEHDGKSLGRWLGPADSIGAKMTYFILTENGHVVARSSVVPLSAQELIDPVEVAARDEFTKKVTEYVGEFDEERILTIDRDEMAEPTQGDPDVDEAEPEQDNDVAAGPDEFQGAEIFLPHEDRTEIAKVMGRKHNHDGNFIGRKHSNPFLDSRVYVVEFPDGTQKDISFNTLAEHLFSQVDEEGKQYRLFREIIGHRRNKAAIEKTDQYRTDGRGRRFKKKTTAGWDLEVEWKDGSTSWLPLKELKETNAVEVSEYAVANHIDDEPAFDWWVREVLKKKTRLIKASRKMHGRTGFKFGIQLPRSIEDALELDKENQNTLWYDAIMKELNNVRVAFDILDDNAKPPPGYKRIPIHWIFDIKMDFTRKARLVAGGHVTETPSFLTYSSVVSRESVRIAFLIAALNGLDVIMSDVGNAYLNAPTKEKFYTVTGKEFGIEEGQAAVIVRALYGLKGSGAAWRAHFATSLRDLGFEASLADPDVWMRKATKPDGTPYWEYILVYVDDQLTISHQAKEIVRQLQEEPFNYTMKDVGPPVRYLGAKIGRQEDENTWFMSANSYLEKALPVIEERFGDLSKVFSRSTLDAPAPTDYHPETDESQLLNEESMQLYQSYIGIMRWSVELSRIDLAHTCATMAKFMSAPREGHLTGVIRAFAYVKKHLHSKIVFDYHKRDWDDIDWVSRDWSEFYPDVKGEQLPTRMPEPRGKPVQVNLWCDAAHVTDLVTRRSTTGIVFFLNGSPVIWYSKRQNTIESSTFGSEFVALRIAAEMNDSLRYKLRMFGVPIDGPTNGFCDNQSVVNNATLPESTLTKKHNSIAYHKVRECVAAQALRIAHEAGKFNLADVLTKFLPAEAHRRCCQCMLWRG